MTLPTELESLQRLGQGRAAEVFAIDDARVMKAMRSGGRDVLEREAAALKAAHAAGVPVPQPHELVEISGRHALVMSRVRGTDMLTLFAQRPWTIFGAGAKLGELHARMHEVVAPSELPTVKDVMAARIATLQAEIRDVVRARLDKLPDLDWLCHLDFVPNNVMVEGGSEPVIIDWPNAGRGDPLADVALTALALEIGTEPPGTPLITRIVSPIGRMLLLRGYLAGYRRKRIIDPQAFAEWRTVAAACRLSYGIAEERPGLLRIIERKFT